jgi:hypothetical protein
MIGTGFDRLDALHQNEPNSARLEKKEWQVQTSTCVFQSDSFRRKSISVDGVNA